VFKRFYERLKAQGKIPKSGSHRLHEKDVCGAQHHGQKSGVMED